jgi:hypothetical protein
MIIASLLLRWHEVCTKITSNPYVIIAGGFFLAQSNALSFFSESIVLLKNDPVNGSPLLPLSKTASIALIGPNANVTETLTSNYHGQLPHIVSVLEGLTAASSGADQFCSLCFVCAVQLTPPLGRCH